MISQNMNSKCQILSNIVIVTQLVVVHKITYIVKRPIIHANSCDHWYDQISWFDLPLNWLLQHPNKSLTISIGSGIQVLTRRGVSGKWVAMKRSRASGKWVITKSSRGSGKQVAMSKWQTSCCDNKEGEVEWLANELLWQKWGN